jgi:hypothetical protein
VDLAEVPTAALAAALIARLRESARACNEQADEIEKQLHRN